MLPKPIRKLLTKIFCKKNLYLEEIGETCYPSNHFGGITNFSDLRNHLRYNRIARRTGTDPRTCWGMDSAFFDWLYCNCRQLLKDTNADLTYQKYKHDGKTYTEGEYIEYLADLCKKVILFDEFKDCPDIEWETEKVTDPDTGYSTIRFLNSEEELERFREQNIKNGKELRALEKEVLDVFYDLLPSLWW